jgi:hypothetical protein
LCMPSRSHLGNLLPPLEIHLSGGKCPLKTCFHLFYFTIHHTMLMNV